MKGDLKNETELKKEFANVKNEIETLKTNQEKLGNDVAEILAILK